jgi:hypothetical protein
VRWWGIGRGYFRNALAVVLLVLLAATLALLLVLRQALRPIMLTAQRGVLPPLSERVMNQTDTIPSWLTLGDWMIFGAICDSCSAAARVYATGDTTCARIEQIYRGVQQQLATELNRYGWGVQRFRFYAHAARLYHRDSIPMSLRWMIQCIQPHVQLTAQYTDSTNSWLHHMLEGRTWWLQLGLADDDPVFLTASGACK